MSPKKAAALLDAAGWELDAAGTRQKDGVKAELTVMYPWGDSTRQALAADLANQLGELGIAAKAEGVDWDTAYARALGQPLVWGWGRTPHGALQHLPHCAGRGYRGVFPLCQRAGGRGDGRRSCRR